MRKLFYYYLEKRLVYIKQINDLLCTKMAQGRILLNALGVLLLAALCVARPAQGTYKICVPEVALSACKKMVTDIAQDNLKIICVSGRDRLECLDKINSRDADFGPVDPEDLYIASQIPGQDLRVIKEIRTKEERTEEFRYQAVAVVHKDLQINSLEELRGRKSCHTGIGRNVGYKIPITRLATLGLLGSLDDTTLTSRENELKALSQFFSKACLVGKYGLDPDTDRRLKTTYSNLCELCENPTTCDYPDKYSGYDGALRCLSDRRGEVAFTKVQYVKKHFGIGGEPATEIRSDDYRYLCLDGSKVPISPNPQCTLGARPWQGYITTGQLQNSIPDLRLAISGAEAIGERNRAEWLTKVLNLDEKTTAVDNKQPISPREHLDRANYTDVIAREYGRKDPIRFCVISETELAKCQDLARAAFSRDIRPKFGCVQQATLLDCLKAIRDNKADVITLDGGELNTAQRDYNVQPIVAEQYGSDREGLYYSVAVVKKGTSYQSIGDLKGAKSCHTGIGRTAGWNIPLYTLISKNLISKTNCPYSRSVSEFFSGGSCVPGALTPEYNPSGTNPESLCSLCAGNAEAPDEETRQKSKCSLTSDEIFFGYSGAFRCLASGVGDVAFVRHTTVTENTDGRNKENWAANLKSQDFELLCRDGGRAAIDQYKTCNLAQVPPHVVVTSNAKSAHDVDAIREAVLGAGNQYTKREDLFRLFGQYRGKKDLLFKDTVTGLVASRGTSDIQTKYSEILTTIRFCQNQPKN